MDIRTNHPKIAVYSHLSQSADDLKHGRVQDADSAFADILDEVENFET